MEGDFLFFGGFFVFLVIYRFVFGRSLVIGFEMFSSEVFCGGRGVFFLFSRRCFRDREIVGGGCLF